MENYEHLQVVHHRHSYLPLCAVISSGLRREAKLFPLRPLNSELGQSRKVQSGFGLFHIGKSRLGCGMTRNEELAAILVRDAGGLEGADPAGLVDDLLFIHAHQGPENK